MTIGTAERREGVVGVISAQPRRAKDAAYADAAATPRIQIAGPGHGPSATIARIRAFAALSAARAGARGLRQMVIEAAYGLEEDALTIEAGDGRRLWAAAVGAALRAVGGRWAITLDGPAASSVPEGAAGRRAVAAALRSGFGAPEAGVVVVARAPGDPAPLAPRLASAARAPVLSATPAIGVGALDVDLAAFSQRACRCAGASPITSNSADGRPLLFASTLGARRLQGVTVYGRGGAAF